MMVLFIDILQTQVYDIGIVETAGEKEIDEETLGYRYQVIYYLLYMYMWMCMYNSKQKLYW